MLKGDSGASFVLLKSFALQCSRGKSQVTHILDLLLMYVMECKVDVKKGFK